MKGIPTPYNRHTTDDLPGVATIAGVDDVTEPVPGTTASAEDAGEAEEFSGATSPSDGDREVTEAANALMTVQETPATEDWLHPDDELYEDNVLRSIEGEVDVKEGDDDVAMEDVREDKEDGDITTEEVESHQGKFDMNSPWDIEANISLRRNDI